MSTGQPEGTRVALPPAPAPPSAAQDPSGVEPEEDLLRDVLDELDKERTKRAQVEADARKMAAEVRRLQTELAQTQQLQAQKSKQEKEEDESQIISRRTFVAMEAQVAGFQQIIDALTLGKPAIAAAAKQQQQTKSRSHPSSRGGSPPTTLPLHVVRLLEVLPWDPRAAEHIFGKEIIYEWQVYDSSPANGGGKGVWHSNIRHFPTRLKQLPLYKAEGNHASGGDGGLLNFLSGEKALSGQPSKHGVLTDVNIQHVLRIETGYPLPADGGRWEWVGGWRIEKRVKQKTTTTTTATEKQTVDCDDEGWSYAVSVQDLVDLPTELAWDNPGPSHERKIRRRAWSRQRVLVDYPYASERTKQYLKLLAENARLTITVTKISDQLVETKTKLTETEQSLMELQSTKATELAKLTRAFQADEDLDKDAAKAGGGGSLGSASSSQHGKRIKDFLQKNEGQVKEIGSKISQWVASSRKTSEDFNEGGSSGLEDTLHDDTAAGRLQKTELTSSASVGSSSAGSLPGGGGGGDSGSNTAFSWRKVGRGALIEKLAGKKLPRARSGSLNIDEEIIVDVVPEEEQDGPTKEEARK